MSLSQKCQYAVRAVFELAKRYGEEPVAISEIAPAQAIPAKFLEAIFAQLRQGGYVDSRRGPQGGYVLTRSPSELTVGEIIQFVDGPIDPVKCTTALEKDRCSLMGQCVFLGLWQRARDALAAVYETTFADLVRQGQEAAETLAPNYCI